MLDAFQWVACWSRSVIVLPLPEIITEEQAPGGHAHPSLSVQKLGNNRVDFRVPFVCVFQFKPKSGESNRHFASLRLCFSCSQLDRYCPYICRYEIFRTEVVEKNKIHVVCPSVLRTAPFWVITQRVVVISYYRRFGTTSWSHPQGSRIVLFARKSKAMFPRLVYLSNAPVIVHVTRNQVIFFLLPRVVYLANIRTLVRFAGCQRVSRARVAYRRA